jgi:hypothetical protein
MGISYSVPIIAAIIATVLIVRKKARNNSEKKN